MSQYNKYSVREMCSRLTSAGKPKRNFRFHIVAPYIQFSHAAAQVSFPNCQTLALWVCGRPERHSTIDYLTNWNFKQEKIWISELCVSDPQFWAAIRRKPLSRLRDTLNKPARWTTEQRSTPLPRWGLNTAVSWPELFSSSEDRKDSIRAFSLSATCMAQSQAAVPWGMIYITSLSRVKV